MDSWQLDIGARPLGSEGVRFRVWAPKARQVAVHLADSTQSPIPLEARDLGYFEGTVPGIPVGTSYAYVLDGGKERPDPASRSQPDGVHHPSVVVDPEAFAWTDQGWKGILHKDLILYELHTGTFTKEGTFQAVIPLLDYLKNDVGVTAVEVMPIAQFPGKRNWGYDGTYLYAPQNSYGGPDGFKQFVNACHARGLAVVLDVVYNHLGPEGNYLGDFGPYFTDRYRTPWGAAINYDGPDSDEVRHFMISNAVYWVVEYHIDALRLDAIHGIFDFSAYHILQELNRAVHEEASKLGRTVSVIAESDLNDSRVITPTDRGGYGLDGQWNDDFHHSLHSLVTGEHHGYYQDFGVLEHLAIGLREGYVIAGKRSRYRRRRHGYSSQGHRPSQFVVFAQNHDQIGNRARGDRLSTQCPERLKLIAATVLLAPNIPLLFMGEEYGETAPFQYFIDHGDPELVEAVRKGRRAEFAPFGWKEEEIPNPHDPRTFELSRVHPGPQTDPERESLLHWTRSLIEMRKAIPAFQAADSDKISYQVFTFERDRVLVLHRWADHGPAGMIILGFNTTPASVRLTEPKGTWSLKLDSATNPLGSQGQATAPATLRVDTPGVELELQAFSALIYLNALAGC